MSKFVGVNQVNLSIEEIKKLNIRRVEICITQSRPYKESLKDALETLEFCEENRIAYSVHLPLYIPKWYQQDYLAAFFLSKNEALRKQSFHLLEMNLKKLEEKNVDYFVLHFPGVNHTDTDHENFKLFLKSSLEEINTLAEKYNAKILLEYFGSNILFNDYYQWIEIIESFSKIGLLLDTGHLYFASKLVPFDFLQAFSVLAKAADAFHFWTTKGSHYYQNNEYYKTYHHIIPNFNQDAKDGWAFDPRFIFNQMLNQKKPIILEASNIYKGHEYLINSIQELLEYAEIFQKDY
ncbi:MAG TPA: TIM barrel protein [Clostridia bacterium]|nr:TIM barrel protein [Clostridia bacterium]